jgi:hypothetical protein
MNFWKIAAIGCLGVSVTAACDGDDENVIAASGGGGATNGGSAGDAGSTTAGKAGMHQGGSVGTAGHAGKSNTSDAGMAGMPAGETGGAGGGEGGIGGSPAGGAGGEGGSPETTGPLAHCSGCVRTNIGSPLWQVAGVIAVAGDVGTTSPDPLIAFLKDMVGPNHAWDDNDFIVGPKLPHAGPYDDEIFSLAVAAGHTPKQAFTKAEFTGPKGVIITFNIIPSAGAATGSSFDFASGPILANALFPLKVDGDMYRNGELYDPFFDGDFGGYPALTPPIDKDGASHLFWFFAEDDAFAPPNTPTSGNYEFRLKITDSGGLGWNLTVPFTVAND